MLLAAFFLFVFAPHRGTLLADVHPLFYEDHWIFLFAASFNMIDAQFVQVHGIMPAQVQDFPLSFTEFHEIPLSSFLQPAEAPPHGSVIIWCINYTPQFCVICTIVEGALCSIVQVSNEAVHLSNLSSVCL